MKTSKRRLVGVRLAAAHELDFRKMKALTKSIETKDEYQFSLELSAKAQEK